MKRLFNKSKGLGKGMSSAVVLSILIHAVLFFLAGMLVVFTVVKKEEKIFIAPKPVERPKMKLRKPKVKVKRTSKPKPTTRIVTKVTKANMPDIQLPEMSGRGDGFSGEIAGFNMMPALNDVSIFGNSQSIGNDFEGEVYSLLYDRRGNTVPMGMHHFREVLRKYVLNGWDDSILARYYCLPKKLYSTYIIVPPIPTALAPGIFGAPGLEDYYLFVKYEGQLVYKEDIRFRFWGVGDAYIFVNVDGKEVLLSTWRPLHTVYFDWWKSSAGADDRKYVLGVQRMVVGDWIELKAGEPVDMKVLFGEWHGGYVSGMLLVEVDGVEYPRGRHHGPLLPIFKTEELSWDSLTEISRFLAEGECSLTNGPVFNDYYSGSPSPAVAKDVPEQKVESPIPATAENTVRLWTLVSGRSMEAEFVTEISGNVILKNAKGKQLKIPMEKLSESDRSHIRYSMKPTLDINFSKTTKQQKFGDTINGVAPPVRANLYTFSTQVKKTSIRPYDFGLTAEFFAIGDEFGGNKNMLLDYQKTEFKLTEENDYMFEFTGNPVEVMDYSMNSERKGTKYGSFLVVIKDSNGEIIAYESPRKNLYRNLDNLQKIKVGWYFDKQCNRCLPTPPKPFISAVTDN